MATDAGENQKVWCHEVKLETFQVEDSQLGNNTEKLKKVVLQYYTKAGYCNKKTQ